MPRRKTPKRARSKSRTRTVKRRRTTSKSTRGRRTGRSMVKFSTRLKAKSRSRSVKRMTSLKKDPRPPSKRAVSKNPTEMVVYKPQTAEQVMAEYRKVNEKQAMKKRMEKIRRQFKAAKEKKNRIAKGVELTAHGVGKIANIVEPLALGFSKWQPELAEYSLPVAGVAAAVKKKADVIEKTAKAAQGDKDAYKQLTDTYKLRKVMGSGGTPNTNLITMDDASRKAIAPYAPYPPTVRIQELD